MGIIWTGAWKLHFPCAWGVGTNIGKSMASSTSYTRYYSETNNTDTEKLLFFENIWWKKGYLDNSITNWIFEIHDPVKESLEY